MRQGKRSLSCTRGRRWLWAASAVLVLFGGIVACSDDATREPSVAARPNVLLILLDTTRADHFGSYGYEVRTTSPNMDALAKRSVRFTRAYSQAPWTTPSVASLLTSRYPSELGLRDVPDPLPEEVPKLAQLLGDAGFATGAVVSHDFLGPRWNFDQGFEEFSSEMAQGHDFVSSPGVTERAVAFLERHREEPFFLMAHYFDPHARYREHEAFAFASGAGLRSSVPTNPRELRRLPASAIDDEALAFLRARYDSELAFTDREIGALLGALARLGLEEDTMVVLTADHGEEFFEHRGFGHTNTLFDELIRVPLLVRLPERFRSPSDALSPGSVSDRVVGLVDVLPTILDVTGVAAPSGIAGQSLLRPADASAPRIVMSETARRFDLVAAISQEGKLVYDRKEGSGHFFEHATNAAERVDRAGDLGAAPEPLRRAVLDWGVEGGAAPSRGDRVEIDAATEERLRAMGYIE